MQHKTEDDIRSTSNQFRNVIQGLIGPVLDLNPNSREYNNPFRCKHSIIDNEQRAQRYCPKQTERTFLLVNFQEEMVSGFID